MRHAQRRRLARPTWVVFAAVAVIFMQWTPQAGLAEDFSIGRLKVGNPRLRMPNKGEDRALLSMAIHNTGDTSDTLISVTSDRLGQADLHVASTRIVPPKGIVIPPHAAVVLEPGRPLVMFQKVTSAVSVDREKIKLAFEKAGELTVEAVVEATGSSRAHEREATERTEDIR